MRRPEDVMESLCGTRGSPSTVRELNKKLYGRIEAWRARRPEGHRPYVYLDGILLKRSWGGEVRNATAPVAIGVSEDGFRRILGVAEGAKEDKASWNTLLRHLKERSLAGVKLFISDTCLGLVEALGEMYPDASWQRCMVHFYRNVFTVAPKGKVREVVAMLKAIHAQEHRREALGKSQSVAKKLEGMKLRKAPDGNPALMLVAARLRHIAGSKCGSRQYLDVSLLKRDRIEEQQSA
ncbi:MAG: transposase [Acidobacteriota bacterium]